MPPKMPPDYLAEKLDHLHVQVELLRTDGYGIELAQKIHKRQFAIPIPWQSNPALIWRHVMAA